MHMGAWDLLLSITAKAMLAAEVLRPGQLVSIVPGCLAISRKTSLVGGPGGRGGPKGVATPVLQRQAGGGGWMHESLREREGEGEI
jgi:hypothetical protein